MGHYWETIYWECNGPINSLLDDLEMSKVIGYGLQHVTYSGHTVLDGVIVIIEH